MSESSLRHPPDRHRGLRHQRQPPRLQRRHLLRVQVEVAEHRFRVMASEAQVIVNGPSHTDEEAFAATIDFLGHLESRWSRFLTDSDVTRLNNAAGVPVEVDPTSVTLVTTMIEAWRVTDARFDPSVLPALVAAGYDTSLVDSHHVTALPGRHAEPGPAILVDMGDIEIDPEENVIALPLGLVIDPGGIGKGLAADLAVARLLDQGSRGALVSIGGDMAMRGTPPTLLSDHHESKAWTVHVEQPDTGDGNLCTLAVDIGGVATSSTHSRRWVNNGRTRHHLIDATRGTESETDLATATIIAECGWLAEAHATAAVLVVSEHVHEYFSDHQLSGIAIPESGEPIISTDLQLWDRDAASVAATAKSAIGPRE